MSQNTDRILFHSLATKCPLALDIDLAKQIGFDGLETSGDKIAAFLQAGYSVSELRERANSLFLPGIGFLINLERQGQAREEMLEEAVKLCGLAAAIGAQGIEVITGPLDLRAYEHNSASVHPEIYRGLLDHPAMEQRILTAENLGLVADIAADYDLTVYLEGLSWTPLKKIDDQVDVIDRSGRKNAKIVIDFWHCYTSGQTPEDIARLDPDIIYGVHVCDSLLYEGGLPNEPVLRDVSTGAGVLDLSEWVNAVKSTGFKGWWSTELFCKRDHEGNAYKVAQNLKAIMDSLIRT